MASRVNAAAASEAETFAATLERAMLKLVTHREEVEATDDDYDDESAECGSASTSDSENDVEWVSAKRIDCMDLSQMSMWPHAHEETEEQEEDKPVTRSRLSCGFGHVELQYLMSKLSTHEGEEFEDVDDDEVSQDESFDGEALEDGGDEASESENSDEGEDEGVPKRVECIDLPHLSLVPDDRVELHLMRSAGPGTSWDAPA